MFEKETFFQMSHFMSFSLLLKNVLRSHTKKIGFSLRFGRMCASVHKDALRKEARQRALFSIIQYYFFASLFCVSLSAVVGQHRKGIFREIFGIFFVNISASDATEASTV